MAEINNEIARLTTERLALLQDYAPHDNKRGRLHDLDERIAALYTRKRAMLAAQRKAQDE